MNESVLIELNITKMFKAISTEVFSVMEKMLKRKIQFQSCV